VSSIHQVFMGKLIACNRFLNFQLEHQTGGAPDSHFIDLARALSIVNCRGYRQGKVYHVAGITVHDSASNTWTRVGVAPDTWVTRNAWAKAYRLWMKYNAQVLQNAPSMKPKYHDFKVYMNTNHQVHDAAGTDVPYPADIQRYAAHISEWDYSMVRLPISGGSPTATPDNDDAFLHLCGDDSGTLGSFVSCGIINGYIETRGITNLNPSPDLDADVAVSWMSNLFDEGDTHDDIIADLATENDQAPYDTANLYGGHSSGRGGVLVGQCNTSTSMPVARIGPMSAICGLLEIITFSATSSNIVGVTIEMMPGKYKGVAVSAIPQ